MQKKSSSKKEIAESVSQSLADMFSKSATNTEARKNENLAILVNKLGKKSAPPESSSPQTLLKK